MSKKDILTRLRTAKSAHIKWRSYAKALVEGVPVDQDQCRSSTRTAPSVSGITAMGRTWIP